MKLAGPKTVERLLNVEKIASALLAEDWHYLLDRLTGVGQKFGQIRRVELRANVLLDVCQILGVLGI